MVASDWFQVGAALPGSQRPELLPSSKHQHRQFCGEGGEATIPCPRWEEEEISERLRFPIRFRSQLKPPSSLHEGQGCRILGLSPPAHSTRILRLVKGGVVGGHCLELPPKDRMRWQRRSQKLSQKLLARHKCHTAPLNNMDSSGGGRELAF